MLKERKEKKRKRKKKKERKEGRGRKEGRKEERKKLGKEKKKQKQYNNNAWEALEELLVFKMQSIYTNILKEYPESLLKSEIM